MAVESSSSGSEPLYLGVDAGNSKTLTIVVDGSGRTRGVGRGRAADIYGANGADEAIGVVFDVIDVALAEAGASLSEVKSAAFRLAGVDWPEDEALWLTRLKGYLRSRTARTVKNDGFATLRCGDASGVGVAVSLGTGIAVAARGPDGREFSMSWWLQDYLGAAGLGFHGIRTAVLAELGMAPPTSLQVTLPRFFGVADVEALIHLGNSRTSNLDHLDFARAARVVTAAYEADDPPAVELVDGQIDRVADYIAAAARRVGLSESDCPTVVLGGAVITETTDRIREGLRAAVLKRMPGASISGNRVVPLFGCALDALAEGGVEVTPDVQATVLATELSEELLTT